MKIYFLYESIWFCWFCTPVQRFWPWFYSGFAGFARLPPKANVQYLELSAWSLR